MKLLMLVLVVILAACAPFAGGIKDDPTPTPPAPLIDPTPAKAFVASNPQRARFEPGAKSATVAGLYLTGTALSVNDTRCTKVDLDVSCTFNVLVPAGLAFALGSGGSNLHGFWTYYRDGLGPYTAKF